jgi:hypothetical protein
MRLATFLRALISISTLNFYIPKSLASSNRRPIHLEWMGLSVKYPLINSLIIHLPNIILSQVSIGISPLVSKDLPEPASNKRTSTPRQRKSYP